MYFNAYFRLYGPKNLIPVYLPMGLHSVFQIYGPKILTRHRARLHQSGPIVIPWAPAQPFTLYATSITEGLFKLRLAATPQRTSTSRESLSYSILVLFVSLETVFLEEFFMNRKFVSIYICFILFYFWKRDQNGSISLWFHWFGVILPKVLIFFPLGFVVVGARIELQMELSLENSEQSPEHDLWRYDTST